MDLQARIRTLESRLDAANRSAGLNLGSVLALVSAGFLAGAWLASRRAPTPTPTPRPDLSRMLFGVSQN